MRRKKIVLIDEEIFGCISPILLDVSRMCFIALVLKASVSDSKHARLIEEGADDILDVRCAKSVFHAKIRAYVRRMARAGGGEGWAMKKR